MRSLAPKGNWNLIKQRMKKILFTSNDIVKSFLSKHIIGAYSERKANILSSSNIFCQQIKLS